MPADIATAAVALVRSADRVPSTAATAAVMPQSVDPGVATSIAESASGDAAIRFGAVSYLVSFAANSVSPEDLDRMSQLVRDPDGKVQGAFLSLVVKVTARTSELTPVLHRELFQLAAEPLADVRSRAKAVTALLKTVPPDDIQARAALQSKEAPLRAAALRCVADNPARFLGETRSLAQVAASGVVTGGSEAERREAARVLENNRSLSTASF